jgi:hypothetical protein
MPTPNEVDRLAQAAVAALSSLANADPTLAAALTPAREAIRAKYPNANVSPGGSIDPG